MNYYHFVSHTLRDGRPVPTDGEWLTHTGPIAICNSGLYASAHPFDALQYAPGSTLCLVELRGIEAWQEDKVAARERRIVKRIDATALCRAFARDCALSVAHLWDMPAVVREYLETGDEAKQAAAAAAARVAADAAARAAADAAASTGRAPADIDGMRTDLARESALALVRGKVTP